MKNIFKNFTKIINIVVIFIICFSIYFASQISSTYPSMRKYNYNVTALKLQESILDLDRADTNFICMITDTVGPKDDLAYHMQITLKIENINYLFHVKYEDNNSFWSNAIKSDLELIGAFDSTHNYGGFNQDNFGVKNLINLFEHEFIFKLDKKQQMGK